MNIPLSSTDCKVGSFATVHIADDGLVGPDPVITWNFAANDDELMIPTVAVLRNRGISLVVLNPSHRG